MDAEAAYRCPGEEYEISRAVHLGRLAGFYPACGGCPHRGDTGSFSLRRVQRLNDVFRRAAEVNPLFHAEGLSGTYLNEIDARVVRRVGEAFGSQLAADLAANSANAATDPAPRVVIADDGRPPTAELAAAAAEGLHWAGCATVDLGSATAACLTLAAVRYQAAGAMLLGNPDGEPGDVGISFWGAVGEPMSAPGSLDGVRRLYHSPAPPPAHPFGAGERLTAEEPYLATLRDHYHALRPLRLVVDTTSVALADYLKRLTGPVAVEIEWGVGNDCADSGVASNARNEAPERSTQRRWAKVGRRVRAADAHFGIGFDGNGEGCRIVDERGELVAVEALWR